MRVKHHNQLISHHKVIIELIGGKDVVYADIPIHDNVGDLLIMLGTLKFFHAESVDPRYMLSAHGTAEKFGKEVILLHGGGNLGDLYGLHQSFRNEIIDRYIENRIIILPQTIYFEDEDNYRKCCQLWSKHKDLHIFVRDKPSLELAKGMTNNVYLVPDMAHHLYPVKPRSTVKKGHVLGIVRQDREAQDLTTVEACYQTDWSKELNNQKLPIKLFVLADKLSGKLRLNIFSNWISKAWVLYSTYLVDKIVKLYSSYDEVHTNRLHGHILATLMEKKQRVYDNSYGKNSSYIECWTKELINERDE